MRRARDILAGVWLALLISYIPGSLGPIVLRLVLLGGIIGCLLWVVTRHIPGCAP